MFQGKKRLKFLKYNKNVLKSKRRIFNSLQFDLQTVDR